MTVPFYKFSATGNDFILIDNRERIVDSDDVPFFRRICQRRTSVGADGVLVIEPDDRYDFRMRYFNADGSETACGNGSRSAAYFFATRVGKSETTFVVLDEVYRARVSGNRVRLTMPEVRDLRNGLNLAQEPDLKEGAFLNTGVPHYVLFAEDVANCDVHNLGQKYRYHQAFKPEGANVDFVQVVDNDRIKLRTYERGVEQETLSCGTGCVAAAYVTNLHLDTRFPTAVETPGGVLLVHRDGDGRFALEGEVRLIFEGDLIME